jgi:hypothetical protein
MHVIYFLYEKWFCMYPMHIFTYKCDLFILIEWMWPTDDMHKLWYTDQNFKKI